MSIQANVDYHAQALADRALSAKDPQIVQSILGDLTKSIQDGAVKPYVGIPLVQSINQHLQGLSQQANMMAALRQAPQVAPEQSLGAQTLASAEPSRGITAAPSNLPTQMASGGIVAFDEGGEVEHYAQGDYIAPTDYDPVEQYRKTRELGQANILAKAYGKPTTSVTAAGIQTPYDPALEFYRGQRQQVPVTAPAYGDINQGISALQKRREAWLAGSTDPYSQTAPVGSMPNLAGTQVPPVTQQTDQTKQPIVIHDDKTATKNTAATTDTTGDSGLTALDDYKKAIQSAQSDREGLKQLILGDDEQRAKDKQIGLLTALMGAGFKTAGGTSQYGITNIAGGGEELAKGIADIQAKEEASKQQRINQLVTLGLKGSELNTELAKLGLTKAEYEAKLPLIKAQAKYYADYKGRSGTSGMGSVSSAVVAQELDRMEGYKANPKTAPFFKNLPLDAQTALLKTDPTSSSYQRAMDLFNREADKHTQGRLGIMQFYGAKQTPSISAIPQD